MDKLTLMIACLSSLITFDAFTQGNVTMLWDVEEDVAPSTYDNLWPRIALNGTQQPVVIWGDNSPATTYSAVKQTAGFTAPAAIHPAAYGPYVSFWIGSTIAMSGDTGWCALFHNQNDWSVHTVTTYDGGITWGDTVRVNGLDGLPALYPSIAAGPMGPVVMYMEHNSGFADPRYVMARSLNNGSNYYPPVQISAPYAPGEVCDCCPGSIVQENDDVLSFFRNNDNNQRDLWGAWSVDGGASVSGASDLEPGSWSLNACPSSGADVLIVGDSAYVVWMTGGSGAWRVLMSSMHITDQGQGPVQMLYNEPLATVEQNYPKIAGQGDTLAVVWQRTYAGQDEVVVATSVTGRSGFSLPDTVNSSPTGDQRNPDIAWDGSAFHVVWQDDQTGTVRIRKGAPHISTGMQPVNAQVVHSLITFPAPASDVIRWDPTGAHVVHARVIDMHGKTVFDQALAGNFLDISALSPGSYLLELLDADRHIQKTGSIMRVK